MKGLSLSSAVAPSNDLEIGKNPEYETAVADKTSLCAPVLMYVPHQPSEPPMDSLPHITPYHQLNTLLNRYVND